MLQRSKIDTARQHWYNDTILVQWHNIGTAAQYWYSGTILCYTTQEGDWAEETCVLNKNLLTKTTLKIYVVFHKHRHTHIFICVCVLKHVSCSLIVSLFVVIDSVLIYPVIKT